MEKDTKYLYECPIYEVDYNIFTEILKKYKTVWLNKSFDDRQYLRPRMYFIEETFNKWLAYHKATTRNYFYDNIKFIVTEYGKGNFKGVKIDVAYNILPPRISVEYKGKVSCVDISLIERMINESPFKRYTFPTLNGMSHTQISSGNTSSIKSYIYELKSKFGDVDITISRKWYHKGIEYTFTIDSESYHNKIMEYQSTFQRCIDHDRKCGYLYNE